MRAISALWLAMAVSASGVPGDPGETALRFLEKVRSRQLNLEPGGDTALAPQTSEPKRREIARRLSRMADDLGGDPLEVGAVHIDGGLAGVLVRKTDGFDPSHMQVFPIAVVKRGETWAAAPVPASFENTGFGYDEALRQRLAALQDWMLREQVLDLATLRDQSNERMRRNIEKALPAETLRTLDSQQAAGRFASACARRNLPEILALLGGLSATLPEDWPLRLKAAEAAVRAADPRRPWHLLMAENVLRVPVYHEEEDGEALVSIACLDPAGSGPQSATLQVEVIHLALAKTAEGFWRVDPPEDFLWDPGENEAPTDDDLDYDLADAFAGKLAGLDPPVPEPSARQAMEALLHRLQDGEFAAAVRLIHPSVEAGNHPYLRVARLWQFLRAPGAIHRAIPLSFQENGDRATAICQFFSARSPDRFDPRVLNFQKTAEGWLWIIKGGEATEAWARAEIKRLEETWQDRLLADCPVIENLADSGSPGEAEARAVVEAWLVATASGDVPAALRLTARLGMPDSKSAVLRNLGYEMTGSQHHSGPPAITGVHRGGVWTAVGVRSAPDGKAAFPLYPVVQTPAGPRILLEIDLFATKNRSREFLNKTALERLRHLPPATAAGLRELFLKYQAGIAEIPPP
ncbi:MAG: hypothetical protein EHM17_03895 [Verrucomicrobiaceae bacterium]|nr:MAG: hypothetical protein EHM17_03895 [Verrucomicrobiaceae bacterium]